MFNPNRNAHGLIARLRRDGFTVNVPPAPYRAVYRLTLSRGEGGHFGHLDVSERKGRALRMEIIWQPTGKTRTVEGYTAMVGLLNTLPKEG